MADDGSRASRRLRSVDERVAGVMALSIPVNSTETNHMNVSPQRVLEDVTRVLGDLDELLKAASTASGDGKEAATTDPEYDRKLAAIRARIDNMQERVAAVDDYFRENTWKTVGAAAALAFIAGLLIGRPARSSDD